MKRPLILTRFVDNWRDNCPGTVDGRKLIKVAIQKERRILKRLFKPVKHIIYVEHGTKKLWYKNKHCHPAVTVMGISRKTNEWDGRSVPLEVYYDRFVRNPETKENKAWLKRNDFELV